MNYNYALLHAAITSFSLTFGTLLPVCHAGAIPVGDAPAPWIFSNGPEYPGATGSLAPLPADIGPGERLTYDTAQGGNYVSASYILPQPISGAAISFLVRNSGGSDAQLRVLDSTGQTLQYCPNRPFSAANPALWYPLTVALVPSALHWGGRNDGIVHQPIVEVTVVAKPALVPTGTLDFGQVEMLSSLSLQVDPNAPAAAAGVTNLAGSLGVEMEHIELQAGRYTLAQSLGFKWIRTELFWTDVETTRGVYDFSWYDQVVSNLARCGLHAHFILCYGNPIYTVGSWMQPPVTPVAIQAFAAFAHAAAVHFAGQGVRFEVWNEPDNASFWADPNAQAYAALAQAAIPQIHAGDPTAEVSAGGTAGIDLGYLNLLIPAGGVAGANAVGVHPYRLEEPETLSGDLVATRVDLGVPGSALPAAIWSTECGYSSAWYGDGDAAANRTLQATYGVRQILTAAGVGIPYQVVFALHDHGTDNLDPEDNFGVVDNAYVPKPLTGAVRTLLGQCAGMTFKGNLPAPESSLHLLKFQDADHILIVAWTDAEGGFGLVLTFPQAPSPALNYMGGPLHVVPAAPGAPASVHVGDTPVYLSFPVAQGTSN
jgi:hypothetical protein